MKRINGDGLKYETLFDFGGMDADTDGRVGRTEDGRYIAIEAALYHIGSAYSAKLTYYELDLQDLKRYAGTAYVRRKLTKDRYEKICGIESLDEAWPILLMDK